MSNDENDDQDSDDEDEDEDDDDGDGGGGGGGGDNDAILRKKELTAPSAFKEGTDAAAGLTNFDDRLTLLRHTKRKALAPSRRRHACCSPWAIAASTQTPHAVVNARGRHPMRAAATLESTGRPLDPAIHCLGQMLPTLLSEHEAAG